MTTPRDQRRGFFHGFRQAPLVYTLVCLLLLTGGALLVYRFWHARIYGNPVDWGHWVGVAALTLIVLWLFRQPWSPARWPRTPAQRWREWRTSYAILAVGALVFAILFTGLACRLWNSLSKIRPAHAPPGATSVPVSDLEHLQLWTGAAMVLVALLFLVAAASLFYFYRRAGRRLRRYTGRCEKCGYSLTGLSAPRCPECGTPFDPRPPLP